MKKIFILFILFSFLICQNTVMADCCYDEEIISKDQMANPNKKAPCACINSTENNYIICKGNVIKIAFQCKFWSDCVNEGEEVYFYVPKDITTCCGELILPMGSKISGYVRGITPQKKFNKNARVYISLNTLTLPDGTELDIKAKPFTKDFSLVENGWMTTGKIVANTVGLGAIGTGAGVGLAFIPRPHKIAIGAGTGVAVGCFLGLVTGLVTPGLKYHAKEGEEINVVLCDDLWIPKCAIKEF